jgi:hypothetical protein
MSWPRAMRPAPITPTLMRLLGAFWPNTVEGTMAGKPMAAAVCSTRRRESLLMTFVLKP